MRSRARSHSSNRAAAPFAYALLAVVCSACSSSANRAPCRRDTAANGSHRILDINCDGFADTVLVGSAPMQVFTGTANGLGTTATQTIAPPAANVGSIVAAPLGDVNGDGYADLVLVRRLWTGTLGNDLVQYFGGSMGLSASPTIVHTDEVANAASIGSERMEIADFDHDGVLDLAVQTAMTGNLFRMKVFLGSPGGLRGDAWSTVEEPSGGEHGPLWSITGSGDFDGDGYADVLLSALGDFTSHATVFRGTPHGLIESVSVPISMSPGRTRTAWVPGDVNGDRYADAVAISIARGSLDVFFGGAHGLATAPSQTIAPTAGEGFSELLAWGDFNGDGMDDALAASVAAGAMRRVVLLTGSLNGLAQATYWSISDPNAGANGEGIEARDFDGDGFADTLLGWTTVESNGTTITDRAIVVRGGAVAPSTPDAPFTVEGRVWE